MFVFSRLGDDFPNVYTLCAPTSSKLCNKANKTLDNFSPAQKVGGVVIRTALTMP
jgi:hypothetical protein